MFVPCAFFKFVTGGAPAAVVAEATAAAFSNATIFKIWNFISASKDDESVKVIVSNEIFLGLESLGESRIIDRIALVPCGSVSF